MKIEVGKFYKTACGRKVGPMTPHYECFEAKVNGDSRLWTINGKREYIGGGVLDIVCECDVEEVESTVWEDMCDLGRGAILVAWQKGATIEYQLFGEGPWSVTDEPIWGDCHAYRVQPELTVVLVEIKGRMTTIGWETTTPDHYNTHKIAFVTLDGEPVLDSIKMDKL